MWCFLEDYADSRIPMHGPGPACRQALALSPFWGVGRKPLRKPGHEEWKTGSRSKSQACEVVRALLPSTRAEARKNYRYFSSSFTAVCV